jgi:tRNA threonylcarbamoyl adenosine modification protein YeaZ
MKILALEFSSPQRSVAVVEMVNGEAEKRSGQALRWLEHEAVETGTDSNKPFGLIEQVLRQAGIEREQVGGLAIGLGPGSYTGIRAAIALAQGWTLARAVHLQGLSSAECVAAQAHSDGLRGRIAVVIDAQRGEFYLCNYELTPSRWQELQPLRLVPPTALTECEKAGEMLVGPEVARWFPQGRTVFPRAATLGRLALERTDFVSGEKIEPIYLRQTSFVKAPPPRILPD